MLAYITLTINGVVLVHTSVGAMHVKLKQCYIMLEHALYPLLTCARVHKNGRLELERETPIGIEAQSQGEIIEPY